MKRNRKSSPLKRSFDNSQEDISSSISSNVSKPTSTPSTSTSSHSQSQTTKLLQLQQEQRALLYQLHLKLTEAEEPDVKFMLPSMSAHWTPYVPLTKEQETAAFEFSNGVIQKHIGLLKRYNDVRDVGQALIGLIAERRGVRVRDCQKEFGVVDGD